MLRRNKQLVDIGIRHRCAPEADFSYLWYHWRHRVITPLTGTTQYIKSRTGFAQGPAPYQKLYFKLTP